MPSRKRAKGKARKAKKNNSILFQHGPHECTHGCCEILSKNDVCCRFLVQLEREVHSLYLHHNNTKTDLTISSAYTATITRLIECNQFNEVFNEKIIQKKLLPQLLRVGTDCLFKDEHKEFHSMLAEVVAVTALCCQHNFHEDEILASKDMGTYRDTLQGSLEYDVIKFFAKRIPCNCLKEMYSRSKSGPKLVYCQNCKKGKDRKHMFFCGGCRCAHYCSVECQKANYSAHCSFCKKCQRLLADKAHVEWTV